MRKRTFIGMALIAAALAGVFLFWLFTGNNSAPRYKTAKVVRGDLMDAVTATGRVNPALSVSISTQVSGTIEKIHVDFNDRVKKGQVLLELDREVYAARLSEAESEVKASRAQLDRSMAEFSQADAAFRRMEELYGQGYVSKNEYESALFDSAGKKAALELARAELNKASAALDVARENLRETVITSPMDGLVLSRDVEEGQTVSASLQAPTLLTVGDLARMEIHAAVDEADIGKVSQGQKVLFYVDSYPQKEFEGEVYKIYYSPLIEQSVVTYNVIVEVDNSGLLLRPGMTATVKIISFQRQNVLLVPNKAFRVKIANGAEKPDGPVLWVMEGRKAVPRRVKTGMGDDENTEVTEGLREGEEVVVDAPAVEEKRPFGMRWYH